jgi:hypothetical protein
MLYWADEVYDWKSYFGQNAATLNSLRDLSKPHSFKLRANSEKSMCFLQVRHWSTEEFMSALPLFSLSDFPPIATLKKLSPGLKKKPQSSTVELFQSQWEQFINARAYNGLKHIIECWQSEPEQVATAESLGLKSIWDYVKTHGHHGLADDFSSLSLSSTVVPAEQVHLQENFLPYPGVNSNANAPAGSSQSTTAPQYVTALATRASTELQPVQVARMDRHLTNLRAQVQTSVRNIPQGFNEFLLGSVVLIIASAEDSRDATHRQTQENRPSAAWEDMDMCPFQPWFAVIIDIHRLGRAATGLPLALRWLHGTKLDGPWSPIQSRTRRNARERWGPWSTELVSNFDEDYTSKQCAPILDNESVPIQIHLDANGYLCYKDSDANLKRISTNESVFASVKYAVRQLVHQLAVRDQDDSVNGSGRSRPRRRLGST